MTQKLYQVFTLVLFLMLTTAMVSCGDSELLKELAAEYGAGDDASDSAGDADGDGVSDADDLCDGTDDALRGYRYKDDDGDGFLVSTAPDQYCSDQSAVGYSITATSASQLQMDNLDQDDSSALTVVTGTSTTELVLGRDFDEDSTLNETYPIYIIANPDQWLDFTRKCSYDGADVTTSCRYNVILATNIDFASKDGSALDGGSGSDGKLTLTEYESTLYSLGKGFSPQNWNSFKGVIDGNGYAIKNLNKSNTSQNISNAGIINYGYAPCLVKNFGYEGDISNGKFHAGGIMVSSLGCTLKRVYYKGSLSATDSDAADADAAGLVVNAIGSGTTTLIEDSYVQGSVQGRRHVGGLVAYHSEGELKISRSYNEATVTNPAGLGSSGVAGLLGTGGGFNDEEYIEYSYNTGTITCTDAGYCAGLVGQGNNLKIKNSYNLGTVDATNHSYRGGLAAKAYNGSYSPNIIENSYNAGSIPYSAITGSANSQVQMKNNYWLDTSSGSAGLSGSYSGSINQAVSKTDAELKSQATFNGWDFTTVWAIDEGSSYPYLRENAPATKPGS